MNTSSDFILESLPHEIINHISTFLENADHGSFITTNQNIHESCRDETQKKYAMKRGVNYFCTHGDLEMVKYCHRINIPFTKGAIDWSARNGHLEIVKWLFENRKDGFTSISIDFASMNGHLHVVKWFSKNTRVVCSEQTMQFALENNHTTIMKWLHENKTECQSKEYVHIIVRYAWISHNFDILLYFRDRGYDVNF